jgi:hypothetical protein
VRGTCAADEAAAGALRAPARTHKKIRILRCYRGIHGGSCRGPEQHFQHTLLRLPSPAVPSSDKLTWSHLWCAWLGRQLLQRVLTPLGRRQERGRVAAVGRAYTLPASLSILLREASFSVLSGLSDRKAPEL